jgi:hypothetical protein
MKNLLKKETDALFCCSVGNRIYFSAEHLARFGRLIWTYVC